MAYSIEATTEDCYPGTTCLINKLGIQDEERLAATEAAIVLGKAGLLDQQPIAGTFDFAHYRAIHHFLFCDFYFLNDPVAQGSCPPAFSREGFFFELRPGF